MKVWFTLFRGPDGDCCATCRHFEDDPKRIEAMLPGLTVLGSAYASVAADDGMCLRHDTYQSRRFGCGDFAALAGGADLVGRSNTLRNSWSKT